MAGLTESNQLQSGTRKSKGWEITHLCHLHTMAAAAATEDGTGCCADLLQGLPPWHGSKQAAWGLSGLSTQHILALHSYLTSPASLEV